ncbi:MAG: agmatine deiminase family protein [Bryobacterales bacterium]|nr:agmatine deiminase family protein [Bryobacterales bacterium]
MVKRERGRNCHVWYQPTIPEFQAHAESDPIDELVFTVDSRSFFIPAGGGSGSSLDIAKAAASRPFRSRVLRLQTKLELDASAQRDAVAHHFGAQGQRVVLQGHPLQQPSAWTQDFLKSGSAGNQNVVLIPRHTFEGDPENGPKLDPLLDSMQRPRWIRSRLSWDGGDLMLARDPGKPSQLTLYFGDAAKLYWGDALSTEEYGYVLMREFGADAAVYAGEIASHVDYALNFLPDGKTAVIASPVTGNFNLSRQALAILIQNHGNLPVLTELKRLHAAPDNIVAAAREDIISLLQQALDVHQEWPRPLDTKALSEAAAYASRHCPDDYSQCTNTAGLKKLLATDPALAKRWAAAATAAVADEPLPKALLGIVASQIAQTDLSRMQRLAKLKLGLAERGFRIAEAPLIGEGRVSQVAWAGISYVNFLGLGNELLTPIFGLGEPEVELLRRFQRTLPEGYRVVAVFAREVLTKNGGVHCVLGVRRSGWENGDWPSVISQGKPRLRWVPPLRLSSKSAEE